MAESDGPPGERAASAAAVPRDGSLSPSPNGGVRRRVRADGCGEHSRRRRHGDELAIRRRSVAHRAAEPDGSRARRRLVRRTSSGLRATAATCSTTTTRSTSASRTRRSSISTRTRTRSGSPPRYGASRARTTCRRRRSRFPSSRTGSVSSSTGSPALATAGRTLGDGLRPRVQAVHLTGRRAHRRIPAAVLPRDERALPRRRDPTGALPADAEVVRRSPSRRRDRRVACPPDGARNTSVRDGVGDDAQQLFVCSAASVVVGPMSVRSDEFEVGSTFVFADAGFSGLELNRVPRVDGSPERVPADAPVPCVVARVQAAVRADVREEDDARSCRCPRTCCPRSRHRRSRR